MRSLFSVISVTQTDALRKKTTEIIQNDMASVIRFFILVVCLAVLHRGIDSAATTAAAVPVQETCTVSTVTEGEPAVMTFKLRSGIDTASETFFAHLRRSDHKLKDIVTCDGAKYVACDVKSGHPMFQVDDNIKENVLTVRISNMSHELEDTYVLQVYFNKTTEPPNICTLNITYTQTTLHTGTGDENGSKGWIPALIICLLLLLIIVIGLLFWKKNPDCWQECKRRLPFKTDQNPQVPTSEIRDEQDQGETKPTAKLLPTQQPQNPCPPSDKNQQVPTSEIRDEQDQGETKPTAKLLPTQQPQNSCPPSNKNQQEATSERPDVQDQGETKPTVKLLHTQQPQDPCPPSNKPPIGKEEMNAHGSMRWFVKNPKEVNVDNLFKYAKPRAGCFVITQTGSSSFTLAVCWKGQGQVDRYYIDQNDSGFTLNNTKEQFNTLCELVSYYKTTPMRVGEKDLGKLSKPCEEEPNKYAWYFGSLNADEVEKLLLANHTEEGSFLVTENVTDEDNYSLSVKFGGKLVPFTIVPQDDGFKIIHTKFRTLEKLVEHYHRNDLDGRGKLRPLEIIPEELTTEEKQILEKPGSFFFKDSSIPGRRVLAVNDNGKVNQFIITKSKDGYRLADHGIVHTSEAALERFYKSKAITLHGEEYGRLRTNRTHKLKEN